MLGAAPADDGPEAMAERKEVSAIIRKALSGMPQAQREIIVLHEIEDMNYEQIAAVLGCSRTSIKLRLFRARRSLKERVHSLMGSDGK